MICAFFQRFLDIIFVADSKRSFEYYVTVYHYLMYSQPKIFTSAEN